METPANCVLGSPTVQLEGVHDQLIFLLTMLGTIHKLLFGLDLAITSGKHSVHTAGSLHAQGLAVDLRTHDKTDEANALFIHVLAFTAAGKPLCYFDERANPAGAHLHLEWHGE